jgi:glycosyltransferase involved in cell wall biosynthesis
MVLTFSSGLGESLPLTVKVVHIFTRFPHPYQGYNALLVERQRRLGIISSVFSFYRGNEIKKPRFLYFKYLAFGLFKISFAISYKRRTRKGLFTSMAFIGRLYPIIRKNPDLIHIHQVHILTDDYRHFFSLLNIPCVLSLRGSDTLVAPLTSDDRRQFFNAAIRFVDGIHTVSNHLAQAVGKLVEQQDRIFVIKRTPDAVKPVSRDVSFEDDEIILTSIGRFNWVKGFTYLLQALRDLLDEGCKIKLNLVGDGNAEERLVIQFFIELLNLRGFVILHGYLNPDQIDRVLKKTHIYVQPSLSEGIPNTVIRAIANNIPVVASNVGGIPEVLGKGSGILVAPANFKSISAAISKICNDKIFRENLYQTENALDFDPEREILQYKDFYRRVILGFNRNS